MEMLLGYISFYSMWVCQFILGIAKHDFLEEIEMMYVLTRGNYDN